MDAAGLAKLVESVGDGLVAVDGAGEVQMCNEAARELLGEGALPDDFPTFEVLRAGAPVRRELCVRGRRARARAWPVRSAGGELTGAVAVLVLDEADSGDPFARELARRDAHLDLLRSAMTAANAAEDLDDALRITLRAVCEFAGWAVGTAQLVCDMPPRFVASPAWYAAEPERYRPFLEATQRTALTMGECLPGRAIQADGPVFFEDLGAAGCFRRGAVARSVGLDTALAIPIRVRDEVVAIFELFAPGHAAPEPEVVRLIQDVGTQIGRVIERDRARRRESFVRAVLDSVGDPIFVKDRSFRWVLLNRVHDELVGFPRETMLGKTDHDFFPAEQAEFFRKKDMEMFASGSRVAVEEEPITDATGKVHWLATTKVPMRDEHGEVTHLVGVIHDITRLKEAEDSLRRRNEELACEVRERTLAVERLRVANRELEHFSYTVSHDLRSPLRAIDGYSRLLQEDCAAEISPRGLHALERVRANVRRMAQLIDDLLALARVARAPLEPAEVDLGRVAQEVFAELARTEPERDVDLVVGEGLVARVDPRLARVLLENLIGNAWKFTGQRSRALIEVGARGGVFYVRDDGAGFDMEYAGSLFKPFTRLHGPEEFPGTGVGLASVKRVVERHGGRVWAEGAVGAGCTVWFTLEPPGAEECGGA